MSRNTKSVEVKLTRMQSRMLLIAAQRMLLDAKALPRGPERKSLETAAQSLEEARHG